MSRLSIILLVVLGVGSCKDKDTPEPESSPAPSDTTTATESESEANKPADEALSKRCAKAIAKVSLDEFMANAPESGKPKPAEQAIIDGVRKQSQAACESEGLTEEQAACFEAIKDIETLFQVADCPAIAAKKPSWLRLPPDAERKKALESMGESKQAPDAGTAADSE